MRPWLLLGCLLFLPLSGQDLSGLPEWARGPAAAAQAEAPPAGAGAWVLLKRYEVAYAGEGEMRIRSLRLVRILSERGLPEGTFSLQSLGGKAQEVRHLRGWNLRPDGELVRLSRDGIAVRDSDAGDDFSRNNVTIAEIARVAPGSLVAFESEEVARMPMGPCKGFYLPEDEPVRRFEVAIARRGGFFSDLREVEVRLRARHWQAWGLAQEALPDGGLAASSITAVPRDERFAPHLDNIWPSVELTFLDPNFAGAPSCRTWDTLASWMHDRYLPALKPSGRLPLKGLPPGDALAAAYRWMAKELVYKVVYLAPERGWLPEPGPEVVRKRYGDCKDHAACFLGEAAGLGFEPFPVLCRIGEGEIEAGQEPYPYVFNHVIAALRLKTSLGLAAEVTTPAGRFLLVDPTDRTCPFGLLPADHRGRRVLICTRQGAVWVTVPASATVPERLEVELTGTVSEGGAVRAKVRLRETGNAPGLRAHRLMAGLAALEPLLLSQGFRLPPAGRLSELASSDPLDLDHPFEVTFVLEHPNGATPRGTSLVLVGWGLPPAPGIIQKPGIPRRLPVAARESMVRSLRAAWTFPHPVRPALPERRSDSPFRTVAWRVLAEDRSVRVELDDEQKEARFDGEARAGAVAAWKKDRSLFQTLADQGLTFLR